MKQLLVLLALMICSAAGAEEIGLVPNDPSQASRNAQKWNEAYKAQPPKSVTVPIGTTYIDDVIRDRPIVGSGRIETDGCTGYPMSGHPTMTGRIARVVQLATRKPALRLGGVGFIIDDPIEFVGDGSAAAIEIEGRANPATGRHVLNYITLHNWAVGYSALPGYWADDGRFVNEETHADNVTIEHASNYRVGVFVRLANLQALEWNVRHWLVEGLLGPPEQIVCDLVRGGSITFSDGVVNHAFPTLFRIWWVNSNAPHMACLNFRQDRVDLADHKSYRCTLVEYAGPRDAAKYYHPRIQITGQLSTRLTGFDHAQDYKVPTDFVFDRSEIKVWEATERGPQLSGRRPEENSR